MDGILNVCKPVGMSSFRALSIVKSRFAKELGIRFKRYKMGHLGTLDPLACGVLVLMCGRATKMAVRLGEANNLKTYRSVFSFGKETTTLDNEGEVVATSDMIPTRAQILAALKGLVGDLEIEVPKYSAVHVDGRRAYDLARNGVDFVAPKRVVNIKRFELLDSVDTLGAPEGMPPPMKTAEYFFEIECQTGTYIRSLAKLLASRLGTVAIASTIIRTKVGEFDLRDSKTIDDVTIGDLISM